MATAVVARPVARPQTRARDEEVLVWPDLVFVEFIAAMLFTCTLFLLSFLINAPLLDQANSDVTPNPSKAPWYLLNLQELLLHMNAAMAGVIIPTIWLVILGAFPYFDRESEGQGKWFSTESSVRITIASALVGFIGTWGLIIWDTGKAAYLLHKWFGITGGRQLAFLESVRSIQSQLPWPEWSTHIPYLPFKVVILGQAFQNLNFPAWLVEQAIPITVLVGMPSLMIFVLWRIGWVVTRRDALLALFSGFVAAYGVLTLVGTAFRGQGQELVFPWELKVSEGIPGQE
jgi:hypothetical protein